jgi:hypothetical protein
MAGLTAIAAYSALALSAVGAGVSAYGAYQQGKSQEAIANYNAALERNRAIQAQQDAKAAAAAQRREKDILTKRQRALYAKAGVTNEGTPLEVMIDTAQQMELEALEIERGGDIMASQHRSQAVIDTYSGKAAKRGAMYSAGATLLQGAGSIAGSFALARHNGIIGSKPTE